jgi:hypothetical protein
VSRKGRRRSTESGIPDTWSLTGRGRVEKEAESEVITSANVSGRSIKVLREGMKSRSAGRVKEDLKADVLAGEGGRQRAGARSKGGLGQGQWRVAESLHGGCPACGRVAVCPRSSGGGWSGPQCRAPGGVGAVGGVESAQAGGGESPLLKASWGGFDLELACWAWPSEGGGRSSPG